MKKMGSPGNYKQCTRPSQYGYLVDLDQTSLGSKICIKQMIRIRIESVCSTERHVDC